MNTTVLTASKSGIRFRSIAGRVQKHFLPAASMAALVCVFSGMGFAINPNRTDLLVMAVSATIALAAAFISDRKGGAE